MNWRGSAEGVVLARAGQDWPMGYVRFQGIHEALGCGWVGDGAVSGKLTENPVTHPIAPTYSFLCSDTDALRSSSRQLEL